MNQDHSHFEEDNHHHHHKKKKKEKENKNSEEIVDNQYKKQIDEKIQLKNINEEDKKTENLNLSLNSINSEYPPFDNSIKLEKKRRNRKIKQKCGILFEFIFDYSKFILFIIGFFAMSSLAIFI
jgi:D-mannonate dehydratase